MLLNCYKREYSDEYGQVLDTLWVSILKCPGCELPIIVESSDRYEAEELLYPLGRVPPAGATKAVARSFSEAIACFRASCFTATAIMCRRTLEVLCHEFGSGGKKQPLAKRLEELKRLGVIGGRLEDWAAALQSGGNFAAHDPDARVSTEDASDLLDFTEAVIEYAYTLHKRFEAYKKRKAEELEDMSPEDLKRSAEGGS